MFCSAPFKRTTPTKHHKHLTSIPARVSCPMPILFNSILSNDAPSTHHAAPHRIAPSAPMFRSHRFRTIKDTLSSCSPRRRVQLQCRWPSQKKPCNASTTTTSTTTTTNDDERRRTTKRRRWPISDVDGHDVEIPNLYVPSTAVCTKSI